MSDRRPRLRTNDHAGSDSPTAAGSSRGSVDRRRALPTRVDHLPPLRRAYLAALAAGLDALGLRLDAPARAAIDAHVRLLLAWNDAINLTAIRDPADVATLHVIDSLTAIPLLGGFGDRLRILDLGSGGGYPGIPIAAAMTSSEVVLLDSVRKKARFLETAVSAAGLADRVSVVPDRAETFGRALGGRPAASFDVVTARAVGSLPDLVRLALPLLRANGRLIAWKRGDIAAEVAAVELASSGTIDVVNVDVPGLDGHVLVVVEKPRRGTSAAFAVSPARRRNVRR